MLRSFAYKFAGVKNISPLLLDLWNSINCTANNCLSYIFLF